MIWRHVKINYLSAVKSRRKQTNCPTVSTFTQIHHSVNSLQWLCSYCRYLMFLLCIVWCLGAVHCTACTVWLAVTEAGVSSWLCKPRPGRRRTVSSSVARDVIVQSYEITATSLRQHHIRQHSSSSNPSTLQCSASACRKYHCQLFPGHDCRDGVGGAENVHVHSVAV